MAVEEPLAYKVYAEFDGDAYLSSSRVKII